MSLRNKMLVGATVAVVGVVYGGLAFGSVVFNGTDSLPHNGYFMLRVAIEPPKGAYVSFKAPSVVAEEFQSLSFVKRVEGTVGDVVSSMDGTVCVNAECRDLLPQLRENGIAALGSQVIPEGFVAVFGDSANSLDSRYDAVGLVSVDDIEAVGFPIPVPHWKTLVDWMAQ